MGRVAVTTCGVNWRPERQSYYFGSERYVHSSGTETAPSHDLSHVFVAAVSGLPWSPQGIDSVVRMAEFNAVFCENLLNNVFTHVYRECLRDDEIVPKAIKHSDWFVNEHYAPFPVTSAEARRQFVEAVKPDALVRLSPIFMRQRWREEALGKVKDPCRVRFSADAEPRADREQRECQAVLREVWNALRVIGIADADAERALHVGERAELRRLRRLHATWTNSRPADPEGIATAH